MPTQEERLSALEQGLAAVQGDFLIHLSENNRQMAALNKVISTQELHSRDIDHNVPILLGIAGSQGKDIKDNRQTQCRVVCKGQPFQEGYLR